MSTPWVDTPYGLMSPSQEWHTCHFCGESVREGLDPQGKRHWLSDCRPDLTEHPEGPLCTWPEMGYSTLDDPHDWSNEKVDQYNKTNGYANCYANYDNENPSYSERGPHINFLTDGPM